MLFYLVLLAPVILLAISLLTPKKKDAPKEVSGLLGVLGLIIKKWENPVEALQAAYNKFGSIFTITFLGPFGPRITILTEPSATSTFFKAPDEVMNQPEVYSFTKYVFGTRVLYDLTPVEATHNIKNLSGALSAARMRTYADLMVKEAREFFNAWGESGTVDLKEEMAKLIINTASRCLLGKEIRELLHEKVASLYHDLDAGLTPISFFAPWLPTGPHRRRDCARQEMQELFRPFIVARREGKTVGEDFLQTLIDSRDKHGVAYDDQQITGMLLLAIFAGQHTSSVTATWTGVMMMLEKPGLMLEVQHEQQRVFAKHNGVFNWDSLGELTLLGQCIKEALRMHPPLMAIMRKAMKDVKIGDTVIPKGDIVVVSPPVCNLSDKVFVDPNTFDPHRFDPDLEELYEQFSYTSFGGGRHGCMGENFAYLQVKCIWSFLLQEFDFSLVEQKKPQQDYDALVVVPKGEVLIKYKRKTTNLLKEKLAPLPARDMSKRRFPAHVKDKKIVSDKPVKKFTRAEVAKHCTREDCWLIVKGKVYDVTSYVVIHKGGDSILKNAGKDNTVGFFGEQHPKAAAEVLEDFYIGDLSD